MARTRRGNRVYEQDYNGVGKLLRSPEIDALIRGKAQAILDHAKANAPRVTGSYADSLELERDETDRVTWNVVSTVAHANYVEFLHRTLGNAIDAANA